MPPTTDHKNSVKKAEINQPFVFWFPQLDSGALPPELPTAPLQPMLGLHPNERDRVLITTKYHEAMWASVIGIQASRFAVSGWSLEGGRPRLQAAMQELLLNSTVGIVRGWVPFAAAGMSAMCTAGKWFIEIERWTSYAGSRVKALHHLDPSRCWITTDPERPVLYIDRMGSAHELREQDVIIIMDQPDETESAMNSPMSAAARAYSKIMQLAAVDTLITEKVSGRRPLAINFIQGLSQSTLIDVMKAGQMEADQKGVVAYMGSVMAGVMGDVPLNLTTIPLAEIPDGFDADAIRKSAHLVYANALGDDPAGIDPSLMASGVLNTGSQATVLDSRASRGGITNILKNQWVHKMNELFRAEKIQFSFTEKDLRDQDQAARNSKLRADTRSVQIADGEITAQQATNLAVDAGDLPPEYVIVDATANVTVADDENPEMEAEAVNREGEEMAAPAPVDTGTEEVPAEKSISTPTEQLLRRLTPASRAAMEKAKKGK